MAKKANSLAPGRFLISEPFMQDKNFQRTVIFLVDHNEMGSLGFVLNRKLEMSVDQLIEDFPHFLAPVFMGGPVEQNTLHYIHRLGEEIEGSLEIQEGVYWGGDFEDLRTKVRLGLARVSDVLFFIGYSGWAPGQLEQELTQDSWIIAQETAQFVFQDDYTDLWRQILRNMGPNFQAISNYPIDPSLN